MSTTLSACGGSSGDDNDRDNDGIETALDCDDRDAAVYQQLPYQSSDADADGFTQNQPGLVCSGAALPVGYSAEPASGWDDCDDQNPATWRMVVVYEDIDGDGVGSPPGVLDCIGMEPPASFSLLGYDPVDNLSDPNSASLNEAELPLWARLAP